jgi:hypothetical protein
VNPRLQITEIEMAEEQTPPKLVVVGLDGSSNAEKALVWTIALARALDAEVIPVYALERPFVAYYPLAVAPPVELLEGWQDEVRGVFENEWCRPLKESRWSPTQPQTPPEFPSIKLLTERCKQPAALAA